MAKIKGTTFDDSKKYSDLKSSIALLEKKKGTSPEIDAELKRRKAAVKKFEALYAAAVEKGYTQSLDSSTYKNLMKYVNKNNPSAKAGLDAYDASVDGDKPKEPLTPAEKRARGLGIAAGAVGAWAALGAIVGAFGGGDLTVWFATQAIPAIGSAIGTVASAMFTLSPTFAIGSLLAVGLAVPLIVKGVKKLWQKGKEKRLLNKQMKQIDKENAQNQKVFNSLMANVGALSEEEIKSMTILTAAQKTALIEARNKKDDEGKSKADRHQEKVDNASKQKGMAAEYEKYGGSKGLAGTAVKAHKQATNLKTFGEFIELHKDLIYSDEDSKTFEDYKTKKETYEDYKTKKETYEDYKTKKETYEDYKTKKETYEKYKTALENEEEAQKTIDTYEEAMHKDAEDGPTAAEKLAQEIEELKEKRAVKQGELDEVNNKKNELTEKLNQARAEGNVVEANKLQEKINDLEPTIEGKTVAIENFDRTIAEKTETHNKYQAAIAGIDNARTTKAIATEAKTPNSEGKKPFDIAEAAYNGIKDKYADAEAAYNEIKDKYADAEAKHDKKYINTTQITFNRSTKTLYEHLLDGKPDNLTQEQYRVQLLTAAKEAGFSREEIAKLGAFIDSFSSEKFNSAILDVENGASYEIGDDGERKIGSKKEDVENLSSDFENQRDDALAICGSKMLEDPEVLAELGKLSVEEIKRLAAEHAAESSMGG